MTTLAAPVYAEDLWQIVAEVWESLLELPAGRADHAFEMLGAVTASVQVNGEWTGLVTVTLPPSTANAVTRAMLGLEDGVEPSREDVVDAVGEVVNVVGGNVKSLLAGSTSLGLPVVQSEWVPVNVQQICRTGVEWPGHVARIGVWSLATSGARAESSEGAR